MRILVLLDDIGGAVAFLDLADLVLVHFDLLVAIGELLHHGSLVLVAPHDGLALFGLLLGLAAKTLVDRVLDFGNFAFEFGILEFQPFDELIFLDGVGGGAGGAGPRSQQGRAQELVIHLYNIELNNFICQVLGFLLPPSFGLRVVGGTYSL